MDVACSSKSQLSQSFLLFVKPPRHPQVGSPVGGSDRVVFINSHLHQLCIWVEGLCVVVWRVNGGWLWVLSLLYAINMGFHGQQSTVWQMKDIRSRQLVLMCMESDGNGGGRASHSAVWGDRKWEDHSIATVPV